MHFTREPIIETVISAREGYKLYLRNTKGARAEITYSVDAVEVVSCGRFSFFRSADRACVFFVPVEDYEIVEDKEARVGLKQPTVSSATAGRGSRRREEREDRYENEREEKKEKEQAQEELPQEKELVSEESHEEEAMPDQGSGTEHGDKRRGRRPRRRRRGGGSHNERPAAPTPVRESNGEGAPVADGSPPPFIAKLFPPPTTLIRETLSRYKTVEEGGMVEEKISFVTEKMESPGFSSEVPHVDHELGADE